MLDETSREQVALDSSRVLATARVGVSVFGRWTRDDFFFTTFAALATRRTRDCQMTWRARLGRL